MMIRPPSKNIQLGLSLVELLIAMTLGLLLTAGALQIMLSSRELYKSGDSLSRVQENGRFALDFLTANIRMAGYGTKEDPALEGDVVYGDACDDLDPCTLNGADTDSDRIGLALDPSADVDCSGTAVGANDVIINVFTVDDLDNDGVNSLYCQGYDPQNDTWITDPPLPLVDGIDSLQVLYGTVDANNLVDQYVSADRVEAVASWAQIGVIKVSVLVSNGLTEGDGELEAKSYDLLDAPTLTLTDRQDRKIYSTNIAINNIIYETVQ